MAPGFVNTPAVNESLDEATRTALAAKHALDRLAEPEEIAELVASWPATPRAS
ncbi:hypothetical protein [Nocardioides sp. Iso805N]|uniref:hypothetical protein n=1 Tax=Nocardioides sp. Iso805N TaxID=1283287 RepID=UPI00038277EA|nr:hypothetical protein [Nocardioides sp. Iso805N]